MNQEIDTHDQVDWQRGMASYLNLFPDVLNGLADALDEIDLSKMDEKKRKEIERKIGAVRSLARLPVPSAPINDGGVARALSAHGNELARMNKITFFEGRVINNAMGIGLAIDWDNVDIQAKGQVRVPPLLLDPDPHSHTTPQLTHVTHTHTANVTEPNGGVGHLHAYDHHHEVYDNCGVDIGYTGAVIVDATSTKNTQYAAAGVTVATVAESPALAAHAANNTGGTALVIVLA